MKTEDLQAKGLSQEQIDFVMAENGKDVNAIKAERDGYKTQLDTAQASLKAMEGVDAAGLQTKVTELTDQLQGKDDEIEKIKADYAFDASLKEAIRKASGRNEKAIMALLDVETLKAYRLNISYIQPEGLEYGYASIQAVPIVDCSEQQEYSMEGNMHVDIRDCRNGVNHLVCAGEGENQQRAVVHLYVQQDGSIGETQYYFGQDEKAEAYIYTSADVTQLKEDGTKRLKDLMNYKKCEMTVEDIDLELGDIVSGYDEITDTQVRKPVVRKILKVQNGSTTIDYKVEGED